MALSVNARRFQCFACGWSGDIFQAVMDLEGVSFPEALRRGAELAGMEVDAERGPVVPPAVIREQELRKSSEAFVGGSPRECGRLLSGLQDFREDLEARAAQLMLAVSIGDLFYADMTLTEKDVGGLYEAIGVVDRDEVSMLGGNDLARRDIWRKWVM